MAAMMRWAQALMTMALLSCLAVPLDGVTAAPTTSTFIYERNGVRLVGGDKTKGRLELRPRGYFPTTDWVQVCDERFGAETAQMLCEMLGYKFGRKYYTPQLAFPLEVTDFKAIDLNCDPNDVSSGRRLLRGAGSSHGEEDDNLNTAGQVEGGVSSSRRGRHLLSPSWGYIDSPSGAPYTCRFRRGTCDPAAPVVGIQCSSKALPPAPPPPPMPPSPPPAPPPAPQLVRIINSISYNEDGTLEPNLCNTTASRAVCNTFARVEMQVDSPNKKAPGKIWAPVCNISNTNLATAVAKLACTQRYQTRLRPWLPLLYYIWSDVSPVPFTIPKGTVTGSTNFNPKNYARWVTITGGNFTTATQLQNLKYKVSASACSKRAMLAIVCSLATNDDAIP